MKIVIAPDKFKGSLTGIEFCHAVASGIHEILPGIKILKIPMADGGDGTMAALETQIPHSKHGVNVRDPLFRNIQAYYLYDETSKTAFIEMSAASGMRLLKPEDQNCYHTTSYGTGELIADALDQGAKKIILGIGGSATNDAGMGMASALGYVFKDKEGNLIEPIGKNLSALESIDTSGVHPKLGKAEVKVACDVINPLYGDNGAAFVYGPQKGASHEQVIQLDQGLRNFSKVLTRTFGESFEDVYGAGAAGGMGAGSMAFLQAKLESGIELVMEMLNFDQKIEGADWIVTGEGKFDYQTLAGKTVNGVIESAKAQNIQVAVFCGEITLPVDAMAAMDIHYAASVIERAKDLQDAMENSSAYLREMAVEFGLKLERMG